MRTTATAGSPSEPLNSSNLGELLDVADVARILHLSENTIRWFLQTGRGKSR
jgi:hypothetical protein